METVSMPTSGIHGNKSHAIKCLDSSMVSVYAISLIYINFCFFSTEGLTWLSKEVIYEQGFYLYREQMTYLKYVSCKTSQPGKNNCVFFFHRRTDPFSDDLLPTEVPALLTGLPDEDIMSDDEM